MLLLVHEAQKFTIYLFEKIIQYYISVSEKSIFRLIIIYRHFSDFFFGIFGSMASFLMGAPDIEKSLPEAQDDFLIYFLFFLTGIKCRVI